MSIKGFPSQQKLVTGQKSHAEFVTIQPTADFRNAIDTVSRVAFRVDSATVARTAGAATGNLSDGFGTAIEDTSTPALAGDYIRFEDGLGAFLEFPVAEVSTNQIRLAVKVPTAQLPAAGDTFFIMRYSTGRVDSSGASLATVTPAAVSFNKDAVLTSVSKDTGTPGNSIPLPTEILVSGVAISPAVTTQLPTSLGAKATAASVAVNIASDQTVPVSGTFWQATQPVSGTFWQATQPVSGPLTDAELRATAVPVSGTFWQATQPVSAAQLPAALGTQVIAASTAVNIASDQTVPVSGTFWQATQPVSIATMPSTPVTGTFWQATQPVSIAASAPALQRSKANAPARNDYTSTSVTTASYVELVASTTSATTRLEIFDSSGQTLVLAVGAAASEVNQFNIFPGGNGIVDLYIPASSRVSIKAVSATASVGEINVNFYT